MSSRSRTGAALRRVTIDGAPAGWSMQTERAVFQVKGSDAVPKVSMVTPVHKAERRISTAVASVLAQTGRDLSLL